jgi:multiple sugar transport system substrate-binding protein
MHVLVNRQTAKRQPVNRQRGPGVRPLAAVAVASAAVIALAACGGSSAATPTAAGAHQSITFATAALGSELQATKAEITSFEKAHPNITVRLVQLASTSNDAYQQLTHYFIAGSSTPDVIDADTAWPASFARAGWITPLNKYVNTGALLPDAAAAGTYQGKLYAAMFYFNAEGLYYRSDLVKQPPKTPQELIADAQAALQTDPSLKEGLAFEGSKYEGAVTVFIDFMGAFGGGLDPGHFDTPANLQALQFLHDTVYKYKIAPGAVTGWTEQNVQEAFTSGQTVFATNWPYVESLVPGSAVAGKTSYVPFPSQSGVGVATLASDALAINSHSTHVPADAEFIKWLLAPGQQITRAIASGDPPSVQAAYTSALFSKAPYFQADQQVFKAGVPRLVSANYLQISSDIQDMLSSVLANQASPAQALQTTAQKLAKLSS